MHGTMMVPDTSGHTEIKWQRGNEIEESIARASYDAAIKKGYQAFRMTASGERGTRMDSFDPTAEKIMMVPRLQGG